MPPPSRAPSARVVAVRVLRDVERGQFSNRALARHLERHPDLDPRDRGLATVLVYGVLRHRQRLDVHINAHARKPGNLRGELREFLRVAAFEILELSRPAAVAISEALGPLRRLQGGGRIAPAVQAILGAVERNAAELDDTLDHAPDLDALERRWSIPRWIAGRWIKHLGGAKARERARALSGPPPVDLRIDVGRIARDQAAVRLLAEHPGIELETVAWSPHSLRARGGGDLFYGPLHGEGLCAIQGLAAQQAALALDPKAGMRVLDGCAGMGVKTLQMAELMGRNGTLVAVDSDADALAKLQAQATRFRGSGLALETVVSELEHSLPELDAEPFDAILLDAPCTGLGNLARHPEIRWLRNFEDLAGRAELQARLLQSCARRLRPGGAMVYAVCSAEPEEGPKLVRAQLLGRSELAYERTFTPEDDGTEGFYVARWVAGE